ncbi:Yip1 family protein [Neobacillus massiliamazoniensis]|uniref:Permease n=1 Tax=Neobacillus massiliamazoniensis TaxID=1499688 RepID=A0A0U1NRU6_9BACI|nr:Yip1 family protein [Neobacillus massiliamazoniensis]CRK80744.1 permease [Neobacillus massiliamazoniensis]
MEVQTELNTKDQKPSLLGMFTSPGVQFERIRQKPKLWVPLLIVSILYIIGMLLMARMLDASTLIDQGVPKDQIDLVLTITKVTVVIAGLLSPIISAIVGSAILLAISKFVNSSVTFKQLLSMNVYIMIIGAVGLVLNMAIRNAIGGDPYVNVTSLAGLFNQGKGVLSSLDVFGIWGMVLTAIGLQKTAQFSKGAAWTVAILFFIVMLGFGLIATLFQGAPKL